MQLINKKGRPLKDKDREVASRIIPMICSLIKLANSLNQAQECIGNVNSLAATIGQAQTSLNTVGNYLNFYRYQDDKSNEKQSS